MNNSTEWTKFDTGPEGIINLHDGSGPVFTGMSGRKNIKLLLHALAWIIMLGLPVYFIRRWQVEKDFIWHYYINIIIYGIIFYSNYLILIPGLFFSSKRFKYYLSVIALVACFYLVSDVSNKMIFRYVPHRAGIERTTGEENRSISPGNQPGTRFSGRPPFRQMHLFNYTVNSLFLVFFSLGMRIIERQTKIEEAQKELEKEKLNSELAFLKNQISPHFFFNTLNNIYSLISINAEDSQKAVLKLSKLMRYLLYESEQGNTLLSSEIDFMVNYIDLMKLRMNNKVSLKVSFPENYIDRNIPPLLFITFIENAFKHGISNRGSSFIDIGMVAGNDRIIFTCINSMVAAEGINDGNTGIGLGNIRKRLNLLFPGKHKLDFDIHDNIYKVTLELQIVT